jgi:site-specific recombinase XerD
MSDLIVYAAPATSGVTVNVSVAMAGLSKHTQRSYQRWLSIYLSDVYQLDKAKIALDALDPQLAIGSLSAANLKAWVGALKAKGLGKQSLGQARAAVVWLAQFMADLELIDYTVPAGLSKVKMPRAESGQRHGTWLTQDQLRHLLITVASGTRNPAKVARDTAIITLMITCGLRRDEIASALWSDLFQQGVNQLLKVHGKGEKMRIAKLPAMTVTALDRWRAYHPTPIGEKALFSHIRKSGLVTTASITDRAVWFLVRKAAVRAGLTNVSPHDLRRSFARGAFEAGVSFELIRQALGHSSIATTERYVNSVLQLDRAATDIWAASLEGNA